MICLLIKNFIFWTLQEVALVWFYTAFTDKFKNEILDYDGIIYFLTNSDGPQRILRNEIYKFNKANQLLLIKDWHIK